MMPIEFKLNGKTVIGRPDETIIETAKKNGVEIPHLCYKPGMRPDGNCRACVVDIKASAPSRPPAAASRRRHGGHHRQSAFGAVAEDGLGAAARRHAGAGIHEEQRGRPLGEEDEHGKPRFEARKQPKMDLSHPAIAVNLDACIQCTRCVRACREEQVNDVIGYAFRGEHSKIVFDMDDPMGGSTCVACGECVQACPTGALMPARE
jgi:formate dehydrogenase major subunit